MGWMDIFSNMSEWETQDLLSGGIIGASVMAKARKNTAERGPKPGKYCNEVCIIDDERCMPCLDIQHRLEQAIDELEKLEETAEMSSEQVQQILNRKRGVKCSLCGAPYETGRKLCSYCGTPYSESGIDIDIPLSKIERNTQIMNKAQEAWDIFVEKYLLYCEYLQQTGSSDWFGKLQSFSGKIGTSYQSLIKQNAAEIKEGADYYGVTLSQYIHGVALGNMKVTKLIRLEQSNAQQNRI